MRLFVRALVVACALTASVAHAQSAKPAKVDPAKEADIRKLLAMTGSAQLGAQVLTQVIGSMKQAMPSVGDQFWKDFSSRVKIGELIDMVIPIYDRNLSHDDIKALVVFYDTPAGKHFVAALPLITQESMAVGGEWGRSIANRVVEQLKKTETKK